MICAKKDDYPREVPYHFNVKIDNHMKSTKMMAIALFAMIFTSVASGQKKNIDLSGQIKTSHLWRGIQVSDELTTAGSIDLMTNDGSLKGGIWGGYGVNGKFKEFDYYVQYSKNGFTAAVWDIYNFSPGLYGFDDEKQYHAFNYDADDTGHFVDLSLSYRISDEVPLQIGWATVIFGRDRALNKDGKMKNQYSNYLWADYAVGSFNGVNVNVGMAGAFAFNKAYHLEETGWVSDKNNFYGKTNGIINLNVTVAKDIMIGNYKLPVFVTGMWNPMAEKVYMSVGVNIF